MAGPPPVGDHRNESTPIAPGVRREPAAPAAAPRGRSARGTAPVELLIALVLLAVGVLAVMRLFPPAGPASAPGRARAAATFYAQEQADRLSALPWNDPSLDVGRHPADADAENLVASPRGQWHYVVTQMAAPLDHLKKVVVTVHWEDRAPRSVSVSVYLRR